MNANESSALTADRRPELLHRLAAREARFVETLAAYH